MTKPTAFRLYRFAALCALLALCGRQAVASDPGTTSVSMLKYDVGGQGLAMGGAMTAIASDVYASNYNPAGIAMVRSPEMSAMFQSGVMDTRMGFFGFAFPLATGGLSGNNQAALVEMWCLAH